MNSNTTQNKYASHPVSTQNPARGLPTWLSSIVSAFTHLGARCRGFIMLLVLVLVAIPSVAPIFPSKVTPANAASDVFSSERAMAHLQVIAREPHSQGSPAQLRLREYLVQELTKSGLEVEVQQTAELENVVARLRGSDSTGAIVVLAHYDTVSYSAGAGDNGSAVAVLVELMRALKSGPAPRNDVIALFDDGEEFPGAFSGTYAFVREHPLMNDVRVAISIDTAVAGPISTNEVGPEDNGWLVQVLANSYTNGAWTSFSGGGQYNSTPFRQAGIQVLALEDNYPFRQKHTREDVFEIIRPASVQQMGDQTLAITRQLGSLDLSNPRSEQETFFSLPVIGFVHYPETWSLPLAITSGILLIPALGLGLWRKFISWRGLAIALVAILISVALAGVGINTLFARVPKLMGWDTNRWPEWPEIIPPHGWLVVSGLGLLVLGLAVGIYLLARRWSARADFSLIGMLPFAIPAVILAVAEPRTAYAFTWPVMVGSLVWIVTAAVSKRQMKWALDVAATLAALPLIALLLVFLPGIIMSDGMKSLAILAGVESLLLGMILPAVDGLLVRPAARG